MRGIGKFGRARSVRVRKYPALFLARKGPPPVVLTVSNVFYVTSAGGACSVVEVIIFSYLL